MCALLRRRALLCAGLLLACGAAQAAEDLAAEVRKRLDASPALRGDFEQTRTLKGFRNPLVSRGDFLLARDKGIVWHTRQPFASTLIATRERLLSRRADGSVALQIDARSEPALRAINEVMFALLGGDVAALSRHFRVAGELLGANGWRLQLQPTDALLANQFVELRIEGDQFVRRVRIDERSGDSSVIRFDALHASPALGKEDAARFDAEPTESPRGG
jgi:hypothetical protein